MQVIACAPGSGGHAPPGAGHGVLPEADARAELARRLADAPPSRVVIASAAPGGGAWADRLPRSLAARWWPTALAGSAGWRWPGRRSLVPLVTPEPGDPAPALALAWPGAAPGRGGLLPLWDGRYVLALSPLDGRDSAAAIAAFAAVAREQAALDLVVLDHPRPAFERIASDLGVGTRVHFAGEAPLGAEWAWLASAQCALVSGAAPVAATRVLRALAAGCPLVGVGEGGAGAALRGWLDDGTGTARARDAAAALRAWVERDARDPAWLVRSRARLAGHTAERIAERLAAALGSTALETRRRAA